MKTKNKIVYGKVEIPAEAFESKNVKERITIFLDEDVVNAFRAQAKVTGEGYQTLINKALRVLVYPRSQREALVMPSGSIDTRALQELLNHRVELMEIIAKHNEKKRS